MIASLDTNAVLSLILSDRPKEQVAVTSILSNHKLHIADMVFTEIEFALSKQYKFSRVEIAANFRMLTSHENIQCNKTLFNRVLPLYELRPALSFVDCCLVHYADINDALPLYTFDKKLVNQSNGLAKAI